MGKFDLCTVLLLDVNVAMTETLLSFAYEPKGACTEFLATRIAC